jgi:hypothetical protein
MNPTAVVVEGTVQPEGTLEVTQKVDLPAGPVHVTVQPVAEPVQPERFWEMMESIWAAQLASDRVRRTREEIDAEIDELRNESEEEMQAAENIRKNFAGPGNEPGVKTSRLHDGFSGRQPGHLPD